MTVIKKINEIYEILRHLESVKSKIQRHAKLMIPKLQNDKSTFYSISFYWILDLY